MNPHLESLGAIEVERDELLSALKILKENQLGDGCFKSQWLEGMLHEFRFTTNQN